MRGKKALVDMALKTGIDEYRFVCFDVDDNGKIDFDSNNYITVSEDMENIANMFLKQRKDIVLSSFLTDSQKKRIICCWSRIRYSKNIKIQACILKCTNACIFVCHNFFIKNFMV